MAENDVSRPFSGLVPMSARVLTEEFCSKQENLKALWTEARSEPSATATFHRWAEALRPLYGDALGLSLFIEHTYLTLLAKLVVYLTLSRDKPAKDAIPDLISGRYFLDRRISNFPGEDFSLWLLGPRLKDTSFALAWTLVEQLSDYDFSKIDEDIFREVYEQTVERNQRRQVGEYYTPEWLVELILDEAITFWKDRNGESIPKILDPACGSGTFLYRAVRTLASQGIATRDIIKSVQGIDINPIATLLAKANYLIATNALIQDLEDVTLPVRTRDSLNSPNLFDLDVQTEKYDIIIGNPPWIVLRSLRNQESQDRLKRDAFKYRLVERKDVHLYTQIELATLFFCKCADLYLEQNGVIAFVMPRSVLAGTIHHIGFRRFAEPPLELAKIVDLEAVKPLFYMPACVLIALNRGTTRYPVPCERYAGELPDRNVRLSQTKGKLSIERSKYTPPDFSREPSHYFDRFRVGASIFPRAFYFADIMSHVQGLVTVKTCDEIYRIVKAPWRVALNGRIEDSFLYATLLAWEMVPFGYIRLRPVILPVRQGPEGYSLLDTRRLKRAGFPGMAKWLQEAEEIWRERRTRKSAKRFPSLLDRLNYNNLLGVQNPSQRYAVLYNSTGTNLVSCVIDRASLPFFMVNRRQLEPRGFVIDVKTWFFETESKSEAYYLTAIFNSPRLSEVIKPLQPKGLFGARAIHRRPLLFPIPAFQDHSSLHRRLARIAQQSHKKVAAMTSLRRNSARSEVRTRLEHEIGEIDEIVSEILNTDLKEE